MKTNLLEFENQDGDCLRGIMTTPDGKINGAAICLPGFERPGTVEKKFKRLADNLAENMIATLRFDFSWTGLSDGDFSKTTIARQGEELLKAIDAFKKEIGDHKVSVVAHSMGAAVFANKLEDIREQVANAVLIAPALNQQDLLRYWFTKGYMKNIDKSIEVTRENFREYLNEEAFQKDCARTDKMSKTNYIGSEYFQTGKELDFSDSLNNTDLDILQIHGWRDDAVPYESNNVEFENVIHIEKGNHDIERVNQTEEWVPKATEFIKKDYIDSPE